MSLIEITQKEKLDNFLKKKKQNNFLQSWDWGEFQKKLGYEIIRVGFLENQELQIVATLIKKKLFFNKNYFYCPRGPVANNQLPIASYQLFFKEIKKIAKNKKISFLRFEPNIKLEIANCKLKIKRTLDIQPRQTLILNLENSEEELLNKMHQKTRYNIRLAEKKGVKIIEASEKDFNEWWKIMSETSGRDGFRTHDKKYYQQMLTLKNIKLYLAKYQNKFIAGNIVSFFGDTATYLHGASSNYYRNVMAPYLLQWHVIKEAKRQGCKYYDFFGISEKKWSGVTRFKKGFSGKEINYPGTFDLVFDGFYYNLYSILRKIRRFFNVKKWIKF